MSVGDGDRVAVSDANADDVGEAAQLDDDVVAVALTDRDGTAVPDAGCVALPLPVTVWDAEGAEELEGVAAGVVDTEGTAVAV